MKIRECILLMLIGCCLLSNSSCISTNKVRKKNTVEALQVSKEFLDGNYLVKERNKEKTVENLWYILSSSYRGKLDNIEIQDSMYIKLELINPNLLSVKLCESNTILEDINLNGKLENNFFSIKRKYFLLPIPFLFIYSDTKNLVGNSKDGNLLVMNGDKGFAWILIMAGGSGGINQHQFEKSK